MPAKIAPDYPPNPGQPAVRVWQVGRPRAMDAGAIRRGSTSTYDYL
jgi:hypothetical protein